MLFLRPTFLLTVTALVATVVADGKTSPTTYRRDDDVTVTLTCQQQEHLPSDNKDKTKKTNSKDERCISTSQDKGVKDTLSDNLIKEALSDENPPKANVPEPIDARWEQLIEYKLDSTGTRFRNL